MASKELRNSGIIKRSKPNTRDKHFAGNLLSDSELEKRGKWTEKGSTLVD